MIFFLTTMSFPNRGEGEGRLGKNSHIFPFFSSGNVPFFKDYRYQFCTPSIYLPTQVKGFEGELKQVLDKAVSTFSFSMVVRVPNFHFFSGQVSDEGLQKMKLLKKKDKKIFIWLQDTSLKYIFIDCFLSCHLLEPLCFFKMCQMSKL